MNDVRTTAAGAIAGAIPIVNALIAACQAGQFKGQDAGQVMLGVALIVLGYLSKDATGAGRQSKN